MVVSCSAAGTGASMAGDNNLHAAALPLPRPAPRGRRFVIASAQFSVGLLIFLARKKVDTEKMACNVVGAFQGILIGTGIGLIC
jgi:hypothetical protein